MKRDSFRVSAQAPRFWCLQVTNSCRMFLCKLYPSGVYIISQNTLACRQNQSRRVSILDKETGSDFKWVSYLPGSLGAQVLFFNNRLPNSRQRSVTVILTDTYVSGQADLRAVRRAEDLDRRSLGA